MNKIWKLKALKKSLEQRSQSNHICDFFVIATYIVLLFLYLIICQRSRLVLYKGEKEELYKLCIEYKIPILYPRLFKSDEPHHYLWGFNKDGIALVGTIIMRRLTKNVESYTE